VFVGRDASERLQATREAVCGHEVSEVGAELIVAVVVEALDGGLLDRAVHALDLAVVPGVVELRETMFDPVGLSDHIEARRPGIDGVAVAGLLWELDVVIRQKRVNLIGHSFEQVL
jgi:hypothetical protein